MLSSELVEKMSLAEDWTTELSKQTRGLVISGIISDKKAVIIACRGKVST